MQEFKYSRDWEKRRGIEQSMGVKRIQATARGLQQRKLLLSARKEFEDILSELEPDQKVLWKTQNTLSLPIIVCSSDNLAYSKKVPPKKEAIDKERKLADIERELENAFQMLTQRISFLDDKRKRK